MVEVKNLCLSTERACLDNRDESCLLQRRAKLNPRKLALWLYAEAKAFFNSITRQNRQTGEDGNRGAWFIHICMKICHSIAYTWYILLYLIIQTYLYEQAETSRQNLICDLLRSKYKIAVVSEVERITEKWHEAELNQRDSNNGATSP